MNAPVVAITGTGSYLPPQRVKNDEIPGFRAANSSYRNFWNTQSRYFLTSEEDAVQMGVSAFKAALAMAGRKASELDAIIVGSSIAAEHRQADCRSMLPRLGMRIRQRLGEHHLVPIDVESGCCSFIVGLEVAAAYLQAGRFRRVAVVTVDAMSRILDMTDPSAIIFGDGSGAAILEFLPQGYGLLHSRLFTDSTHYELAGVKWRYPKAAGGPYKPYFYVDTGLKMAEFVPRIIPQAITEVLSDTGMTADEIDLFVLHQPGRILLNQWKDKFGLNSQRAPDIHAECACLSSSSVSVTLDRAVRKQALKKGQTFIIAGAAIGWTWGAQIWRWNGP